MARRNSAKLTNRVWRLLRLAVLWAKKGGAFKHNRALLQIRLLKTLRLRHSRRQATPRLQFEREFSFEETPTFKFKTPSLRFLPCITPLVDQDFDRDELDDLLFYHQQANEHDHDQLIQQDHRELEHVAESIKEAERSEERGIDDKAEEFITRFYEEMKLQRQISAIQYYEMLERSV